MSPSASGRCGTRCDGGSFRSKKSLQAAEQERSDVRAERAVFFERFKDVRLSDVVVLDESYATTKFTRSYGRSPVGEARRPGAARDWKFLTIIAAISIDGVLAGASIDASTDADVFGSFVTDVLAPSLRPGQVVVKSVRC